MRKLKTLISAVWMLGSATCMAAPFCVVATGSAPDCRFEDQTTCQQAAELQHGTCFVNSGLSMRLAQHQDSRYCLVTKTGAEQCDFPNMDACARAGKATGGTCFAQSRLAH